MKTSEQNTLLMTLFIYRQVLHIAPFIFLTWARRECQADSASSQFYALSFVVRHEGESRENRKEKGVTRLGTSALRFCHSKRKLYLPQVIG
jgi:hypothetical protein